jgi:hypothetical protein
MKSQASAPVKTTINGGKKETDREEQDLRYFQSLSIFAGIYSI